MIFFNVKILQMKKKKNTKIQDFMKFLEKKIMLLYFFIEMLEVPAKEFGLQIF